MLYNYIKTVIQPEEHGDEKFPGKLSGYALTP